MAMTKQRKPRIGDLWINRRKMWAFTLTGDGWMLLQNPTPLDAMLRAAEMLEITSKFSGTEIFRKNTDPLGARRYE
jgi:hypothetical protein